MKRTTILLIGVFISSMSFGQLMDDLIAHFSFNNSYTDQVGNVTNGVNHGTSFTADRNMTANGALSFSGDDYYSFNTNALKIPFPITIATWVKLDDLDLSQPIFFSDNYFGDYHGYWLNIQQGTGKLAINFGGGAGGDGSSNRITYVSNQGLQENQWYHVIGIIRDWNDMELYIDCDEVAGSFSGTGPHTIAYSSTDSRIGSFIGFNTAPDPIYLDGDLDDLMIWKRALTQQDIGKLCQMTLHVNEPAEQELSAMLVPNPATDFAEIRTEKAGDYAVNVFEPSGKLVHSETFEGTNTLTLDLSGLSPQIYFVEVNGANGRTVLRAVKQ